MSITGPTLSIERECEQVLRSLPGWFGIESSLLEYVRDTARLPTFAEWRDDKVVGFLSLRQHFPKAWELHCIAVHRDHRGSGIGRRLVEHAERWLINQGAVFLQVKTIADTSPNPEYRETRAFYDRLGFMPLEVFPELWSPQNPCLLLVKRLGEERFGLETD